MSTAHQRVLQSLTSAAKWIVPHGIGRAGARRMALREAEDHARRIRTLYALFVPSGSLAFDIGANLGNRIAPLLACGARVVAVEPQAACCRQIRRVFGSQITLVEAAVAARAGSMTLRTSQEFDNVASLSPDFIARAKTSGRVGERDWSRETEVVVTTLDRLIEEHGVPSFIKIDVEGFEFEVLRGLTREVPALSFEWTSDLPQSALDCIRRCGEIGLHHFNFSFGESLLLSHAKSIGAEEAGQLVRLLGEDLRLFGDIYATREPLVRPGG